MFALPYPERIFQVTKPNPTQPCWEHHLTFPFPPHSHPTQQEAKQASCLEALWQRFSTAKHSAMCSCNVCRTSVCIVKILEKLELLKLVLSPQSFLSGRTCTKEEPAIRGHTYNQCPNPISLKQGVGTTHLFRLP